MKCDDRGAWTDLNFDPSACNESSGIVYFGRRLSFGRSGSSVAGAPRLPSSHIAQNNRRGWA